MPSYNLVRETSIRKKTKTRVILLNHILNICGTSVSVRIVAQNIENREKRAKMFKQKVNYGCQSIGITIIRFNDKIKYNDSVTKMNDLKNTKIKYFTECVLFSEIKTNAINI